MITHVPELDYIWNILKNHPIEVGFNFSPVDESIINDEIDSLDKKPTTNNNIPTSSSGL